MLTKRQNFLETIRGGNPDRFVNQFEALSMIRANPASIKRRRPSKGGENVKDDWGVTFSFPDNVPGPFPVLDDEHKLVKDITKWREVVHAPSLDFPEEMWQEFKEKYVDTIDRNEYFATVMVAPGMFERSHYLMGMEDVMLAMYTDPDEVKALLDYIADYEVEYANVVCKYFKPDALFHHDDWGSQISSFLSPEMFEEFIVPVYKRVYGAWKEGGVEVIVHHSDSFGANLVPYMIEVGIDVWQGCMTSNDVPALIEKYGGKMTFMGDIDNKAVDFEGWTQADCTKAALDSIKRCGDKYFIPCITQGGPGSLYNGTYKGLWDAIDQYNCQTYGHKQEDIEANRLPINIMF